MRGASADSLSALLEDLSPQGGVRATASRIASKVAGALTGGDTGATGVTGRLDAEQADRVGDDLFGVADVLRREPRLRRTFTDGSLPAAAKAGLARDVFSSAIDSHSMDLVSSAVGHRWTAPRDLADALEHVGVVAAVKAAEERGEADRVESELFTFEQALDDPGLRDALSDPARSSADKRTLIGDLLGDRASSTTVRLARQAASGSHRTVALAVQDYQKIAARHRERLVATVQVARELTDDDARRLSAALERQYGRPVHLNVEVDPDVVGGLRVEIGDDVIDGTVSSRLDEARRRLAG